ncbi:hypothetical protein [Lysobacter auxotrophicus]|nr:hypothetical protein [Lysobacter auxotrophicus]
MRCSSPRCFGRAALPISCDVLQESAAQRRDWLASTFALIAEAAC